MDVNYGISSAGDNFANAIGLSGQRYIDLNTSSEPVSANFNINLADVDYIKRYVEPTKVNTTKNTSKLNSSLFYDVKGVAVEKQKLSEIIPSYKKIYKKLQVL